jgi:hypothetical protein
VDLDAERSSGDQGRGRAPTQSSSMDSPMVLQLPSASACLGFLLRHASLSPTSITPSSPLLTDALPINTAPAQAPRQSPPSPTNTEVGQGGGVKRTG